MFIITIPIGKVLLFLKPLKSNATNIAKGIFIIKTEDIHKKEQLVMKKCWRGKNLPEFWKKNQEY